MFSGKIIRETLKKYIDRGIRKYVIYPFGENGMAVKRYMEECFGLSPIMVVDNIYSQYNAQIVNIDELRKHYREDMYVILTIEDNTFNTEMLKELFEFVPHDRIINDLSDVKKIEEYKLRNAYDRLEVRDRFSIKNILPKKNTGYQIGQLEEKIKVRIAHMSYGMWNSVKTICNAFEKDNRFDVLVILCNQAKDSTKRIIKQMESEGHKYVLDSEYCAKEDKADILIVSMHSARWYIKGSRENTKLIIAASMALIRYSYSIEEYWLCENKGLSMYNPDYYIFDSLIFNELRNSEFFSNKIVEMGNAKFDGIYNACMGKEYPEKWKKLKGKKTILWATDHGVYNGRITDNITFDLYAYSIFQYAEKHTDLGFIVRLHPSFIKELLMYEYWSEQDLNDVIMYCENTPNVIWDDSDLYDMAYAVADAVLTDAFCGITISALPMLKPICVMYRNDMRVVPFHKEVVDNYYSACDEEKLNVFFDMVKEGKDPMLAQREAISKKYVKNFDGRNGERIKEFIVSVFEKKYGEI